MRETDDMMLVQRAQSGDVQAVGLLYDRYHQSIFRYVVSRVQDTRLAEDLTGEVFTRMVTSLPGYEDTGFPFRAWLYRIARNLIVDHYRKHQNRPTVSLDEANLASADQTFTAVVTNLTKESIYIALAKIDPMQREVVILRFIIGLPLNEVALMLDKTVAAIKSLQHRGLNSLRLVLNQG